LEYVVLTFCLASFLFGALLGAMVTVRQFIVGALLLASAALALGIYVGLPWGRALLATLALLVCIQLGYVAGMGLRALTRAKPGGSQKSKTASKAHAMPNTITRTINRVPPP
jgi:hypothetical protein